ncbi:TPA: hypothetical protein ACULGH_000327 [Escherichia coli]
MKNYLSNLASMLQGIAGVISDGERVQKECPAHLKSALLEASHALDGQSVRVNYPPNGKPEIVKAGALILAEIERIDRAAGIGKGE